MEHAGWIAMIVAVCAAIIAAVISGIRRRTAQPAVIAQLTTAQPGIESTRHFERLTTIPSSVKRQRARVAFESLDASHCFPLWNLWDSGRSIQRQAVAHDSLG